MPVTITLCSSHSVDNKNTKVTDFAQGTHDLLETALKTARAKESSESEKILQSSFADADLKDSNVHAAANGFVHTAIEAYSENHHLTIRPEDVWFAILSQLNIWINTNAQEARGKIFAHDGKKSLTLNVQNGDFGKLAEDITREIEKNATSPEMREWIMPAFTTTTATDTVVASALLMGAIPEYSCDLAPSECYSQTFPPVTLFGEQSDWEELYKKLDKLETFGTEPAQFGSLLKPVISRFIKSFNDPNGDDVVGFWGHMISDASSNAGEYFGWISAFCFWSKEGEDLHDRHIQFRGGRGFTLDGVIYHNIDSSQIQPVYVSVPVKVNDNGKELDTIMIAGSVGTRYTSSDGAGTGSGVGLDSVNPVSGWWIFVKKDNVEETAEAIEASSGKLPDDTEPATSAPDQQAVALQEDSPVTPASSSSVKDQGLISRLINLFSRTDISK